MTTAIILMDTGPGYRTPEKAKDWNESGEKAANILNTQGMKGFMESEYSSSDYYTTPDVMMKHNPKGLANIRLGAMINPWGLDILPNIKVPAFVICGDRDAAFLPATDYMAGKIPGARKEIVANAGHGVNIDQPQVFESIVLDFLNGLKLVS